MRIAVRIWVVVGFTVALATWTTMTALVRGPAWLVSLPVVGTVWLLVCMDVGYLLGRNLAHRRRRQSSQPRRDVWTPDPAVRRPIDFPLVLPRPTDDDPVDHQGRFRATGVRLAVLPALAVVFLTVQTVFLDRGSHLGIGFVLAECLLLVWMVWTVWTEQEPSRPWVTSRVRAELFRREMFLLLASVGPYLGRSGQQAEQVRDARLARLAAADLAGLAVFARLADHAADGTERDWRDEVWRQWYRGSGSMGATASAGLTDLMRTYLDYRIRRQSLYFELAADKCERTEQKLGAVAKASVLGAVAMAVVYAALLIADNGRGDRRRPLQWSPCLPRVCPRCATRYWRCRTCSRRSGWRRPIARPARNSWSTRVPCVRCLPTLPVPTWRPHSARWSSGSRRPSQRRSVAGGSLSPNLSSRRVCRSWLCGAQ